MTNRPPVLIGLAGPAGCGKTTICKALIKALGGDGACIRVRFAGPLKSALRAIGLTEAQVDGDQKEAPLELLCGRSARYAMMTMGTQWGRDIIGDNLWVNAAMKQVDEVMAQGVSVVMDDLRFDNEAEAILARRGAYIIELKRDGASYSTKHASEAGISAVFLSDSLSNDGEAEEAVQAILKITNRHRVRKGFLG